jgi:UDP-N-acetylmuramate dehydrogenase
MLILENQILKNYTTIGIGGAVKYMFFPTTKKELIEAILFCKKETLPFVFLAGGSNTVFPDTTLEYDQVVINLTHFNTIDYKDNQLIAKSGVVLQKMVDLMMELKSGCMVGLNRVPGTVGGAVVGNAGAYGTEIKDIVKKVHCIRLSDVYKYGQKARILKLTNKDCKFGYRDSLFKQEKDFVVLEAFFDIPKSVDFEVDLQKYNEISIKRDAIYPVGFASPGSLFKNILFDKLDTEAQKNVPNEWVVYGNKLPVGKLLESLDCKGFRIGGVQMRESHANIMVNVDSGSFQDARNVVLELQNKINQKFGIKIEPEVRFMPDNFGDFWLEINKK